MLVQDWQLFEKHAHFNRERIPERVVHAKGSGAYGTFICTGDVTRFTKYPVSQSETSGKAGGLKCEPLKAVGASR